jgi:hypothetical protein
VVSNHLDSNKITLQSQSLSQSPTKAFLGKGKRILRIYVLLKTGIYKEELAHRAGKSLVKIVLYRRAAPLFKDSNI